MKNGQDFMKTRSAPNLFFHLGKYLAQVRFNILVRTISVIAAGFFAIAVPCQAWPQIAASSSCHERLPRIGIDSGRYFELIKSEARDDRIILRLNIYGYDWKFTGPARLNLLYSVDGGHRSGISSDAFRPRGNNHITIQLLGLSPGIHAVQIALERQGTTLNSATYCIPAP